LSVLARAIRSVLVGPVEQFGVDAAALDQTVEPIPSATTALIALDAEYLELTDQIAKNAVALAWHHSHPSRRSARSIWAVAASMSDMFLVSAAVNTSSAA
jgi:hypothetical protein